MSKYEDDLHASQFAERRYKAYMHEQKTILANQTSKEDEIYAIKESAELKRKAYGEALIGLKESLLFEALNGICQGSLKIATESSRSLMSNLVMDYIKENGASNLIKKMTKKSYMLSEMAYIVEEAYDDISKDINPDCLDPDKEKVEDFMDRIGRLQSAEDVENAIRIKVANAEEEFITDNIEDKFNSNNVINMVNDRINALKQDRYSDEPELGEAIEQESAKIVQMGFEKISSRQKSLFESMVLKLSNTAMKDTGVVKEQLTSNGDLDVDAVVESVRTIYTFMEALHTMKLESMDQKTVQEFIVNF